MGLPTSFDHHTHIRQALFEKWLVTHPLFMSPLWGEKSSGSAADPWRLRVPQRPRVVASEFGPRAAGESSASAAEAPGCVCVCVCVS